MRTGNYIQGGRGKIKISQVHLCQIRSKMRSFKNQMQVSALNKVERLLRAISTNFSVEKKFQSCSGGGGISPPPGVEVRYHAQAEAPYPTLNSKSFFGF